MSRAGRAWVGSALLVALGLPAAADPKGETEPATPAPVGAERQEPRHADAADPASGALPIFVPRDAGAPQTRVGGATRGIELGRLPRVQALVPNQLGHSLESRPTLYWHLSEATQHRVDLTLLAAGSDPSHPLLQVTLPGPFSAGASAIRLADHGVELERGVTYIWYLSLVPNPERRSEDRVSGGAIEVIEAPAPLADALAAARASERPVLLAAAGIWYDALRLLAEQIEADPGNALARAQRAALLEQVGLPAAP